MSVIKFIPLLLLLAACENQTHDEATDTGAKDAVTVPKPSTDMDHHGDFIEEKNGIGLYYFKPSPDFPDAELRLKGPAQMEDGKLLFTYAVKNYELGAQTGGASAEHCANSAQGQHIHHIIDNEPYKALYKDTVTRSLSPGSHVHLAFLSRSYHESIKNGRAFVLSQFNVGTTDKAAVNLDAPMMFYSRPKGEYKGDDRKFILLDFYLTNTELSEAGNHVRATVNGAVFMLNKWVPYGITGLPDGETKIKLELVDANGAVVPGPFNSVERSITLMP